MTARVGLAIALILSALSPADSVTLVDINPITFGMDLLDSDQCLLGRTGTEFPSDVHHVIARYGYRGSGSVTTTWYLGGISLVAITDPLSTDGQCSWVRLGGSFPNGEYRVEVTSAGQPLESATFRVGAERGMIGSAALYVLASGTRSISPTADLLRAHPGRPSAAAVAGPGG